MAEQQAAMAEQQQATTRKFDPEAMQMQTELDIQKNQTQQSGKLEADIAKMRERSRLQQENEAAKSITEVGREKLKAELVPQRPKNSSS
jgi:predicted transcriptional regulator